MPLITIITATYNAAKHLPALIGSIRGQNYGNIEWIVVDGASTDGTQDILMKNQDVVSNWISESDQGIFDAWNKGVALARGEWIGFLGADDFLWNPDALSQLMPILSEAYPTIRVVYGKLAVVNREGQTLYTLGEDWVVVRRRFRSVMALPHPGLMHHRSLFVEYGGFDTSFRIAGDYEWLLRALRGHDALFVPEITVAGMTLGGVSTTPTASWAMLKEMRRATRKHVGAFPGFPWLLSLVRYGLRRVLWGALGESRARRMLDTGRKLCGQPAHWTRS